MQQAHLYVAAWVFVFAFATWLAGKGFTLQVVSQLFDTWVFLELLDVGHLVSTMSCLFYVCSLTSSALHLCFR